MRFNPFTGHDTVRFGDKDGKIMGGGGWICKNEMSRQVWRQDGTGRLSFSPVLGVWRSERTSAPAEGIMTSSTRTEPETSLLNQAERNMTFRRLKRRMRDLIKREIKIHAEKSHWLSSSPGHAVGKAHVGSSQAKINQPTGPLLLFAVGNKSVNTCSSLRFGIQCDAGKKKKDNKTNGI